MMMGTSHNTTERRGCVRALVVCVALAPSLFAAGCDVGPARAPSEWNQSQSTSVPQDMLNNLTVGDMEVPTEPGACGDEPEVCCGERLFTRVQGDRLVNEVCAADQVCRDYLGCIRPTDAVCEDGDVLALSHERMFFVPTGDGKSTTQTLYLTNCTGGDLLVRPVRARSHLRPNGRDQVFSLGLGSWLEPITLLPGTQEKVTIVFQQRDESWLEDGVVEIEYARDLSELSEPRFERVDVPLQTQTECLTYPERIDYPSHVVYGQPFTVEIPVMNCGSKPLGLVEMANSPASDEDSTGFTPETFQISAIAARASGNRMSLDPGELGTFSVEVTYDKTLLPDALGSAPVMGPGRMFFRPIVGGRSWDEIDVRFTVYENSNPRESDLLSFDGTSLTDNIWVSSRPMGASSGGPTIDDNFIVYLDEGGLDAPYPYHEFMHESRVPPGDAYWFYSSAECAQNAKYPQDCVDEGDILAQGWLVDMSLDDAELPVNTNTYLPRSRMHGLDVLQRRNNRSFFFSPKVAGTYSVSWRVVPPSASVHGGELGGELIAQPSPNTPIYAELTWRAEGSGLKGERRDLRDEIPADERPNASADLDLHVLAVPKNNPACFADSRFDCSVKSQFYAAEGDRIPSCLDWGDGPIAQMYRSSISGGDPEVVRMLGIDDGKSLFAEDKLDPLADIEQVRFGVHLNRKSGFGRVRAMLRVWYFGNKVYEEELELDAETGFDQFATFSSALDTQELWRDLRSSTLREEDYFRPDAFFDFTTTGPYGLCF